MGTIADLQVRLSANVEGFKKKLGSAKKDVKGFKGSIVSAGSKIASVFKVGMVAAIGATVAALAALAVGAAAASAALFALTFKQFSSIDALGKQADKIGITTEKLAALRLAADRTGAGADTMDAALEKMGKRAALAAKGTGAAVKAFKELGISAVAFSKLSPDEQFAELADKMNQVTDQSNKLALTSEILGDSGRSLINTMALGSDGLAAFDKKAQRLGLTLSRGAVAGVESFSDSFDDMKDSIKGIGIQLAPVLAPFLQNFTEILTEGAVRFRGFIEGFKPALAAFTGVWQTTWAVAKAIFAQVWDGLKAIFVPIFDQISKNLGFAEASFDGFTGGIEGAIKSLSPIIESIGSVVGSVVGKVVGWIKILEPSFRAFINRVMSVFATAKAIVVGVFDIVSAAVKPIVNLFSSVFGSAGGALGLFSAAHVGVEKTITAMADKIREVIPPIVAVVSEFASAVGKRFAQMFAIARAIFLALFGVVKSVFQAIGAVIKTVTTFVKNIFAKVWPDSIGSVGDAFTSLKDMWLAVEALLLKGLIAVEFGITNFADVWEIMIAATALGMVRFANDMANLFTNVLPNAFLTLLSLQKTIFAEMVKLAFQTGKGIARGLLGLGFDIEFDFTNLTDALKKATADVAKTFQRDEGAVEKSLREDLERKMGKFKQGLDAFTKERLAVFEGGGDAEAAIVKKAAAVGDAVSDGVEKGAIAAIKDAAIAAVEVDDIKVDDKTKQNQNLTAPGVALEGSLKAFDIIAKAQAANKQDPQLAAAVAMRKAVEVGNKLFAKMLTLIRDNGLLPANL